MPQDFPTIQAAITAARGGDTILIAPGTYSESLKITQSLTLQGQSRDAVTLQGNRQDPTVTITRVQDVTITDLTIRDGSGGTGDQGRGGGLHIEDSAVTLRNLIVRNNLRNGLLARRSTLTVRDSQFSSNQFDPAGKVGRGITLVQSNATIENSTISGNAGGAVGVLGSQAQIRGNSVTDNGFGIDVFDNEGKASKAVIENNTIARNVEEGILVSDKSEAEIVNNRITDNKPDAKGEFGDGIAVDKNGRATIRDNTISDNAGVGLDLSENAHATLENNTIARNVEDGIFVTDNSEVQILNNRIIDTKANAQGKFGRGIALTDSARVTITSNTITGNKEYGIGLGRAVQATILKNTISDNGGGIFIGFGDVSGETAQAEISQNTIQNNSDCGVLVDSDEPQIRITGQGNNITDNRRGNLCGDMFKFPPGFGGGR
ncbi:right-handed parallel beta-helix repeat-containing protein [Candidatus Acetothermia bacterium]|nr:right-handed parallel beta-helix repeat-containing protein [Candidatus Acetothermia bacterium]